MDKKQQDPALEQILDELDSGGIPRPAEPSVRQEQPTKVRFLHSETEQMPMRVNVPSGQRQETPQPQPVRNFSDDSPKIRRMSDSTRAREIEKIKKKNKKNLKRSSDLQEEQTYARERPEGDYMYTQIHGVKRAQKRKKVKRTPDLTAAGTETIQLDVKDIVNVKKLPEPEPVQPVEIQPAPRAEKTSLDLTMPLDRDEIDVAIKRSKEEAEELNKRQREFQSKMELRSISDIRGDIDELRSAMVFRIFALLGVFAISALLAIGSDKGFGWVQQMPPLMTAIMQFLLAGAAAIVCTPVLRNGLHRLVTFQADTDSLAAAAFVSCTLVTLVNAVLSVIKKEPFPCYLPCAVLTLLLHSVGKILIVSRELANLRLATGRDNCSGMAIVEDEQRADALARGVLGDFPILAALRRTDSLIDFRKYTYSADLADRFCRVTAPLIAIASLAASIALTFLKAQHVGYTIQLFSMLTAAASCASLTFVVNLPLFQATRSMAKNGALLLGYQSVDDFYDANALMLDASTLFPGNSAYLAGMKLFSNVNTDETLRAAASLAAYAGSVIGSVFSDVFENGDTHLYPVENYVYEDSLGLCGWIHSQRVLLGSRELMRAHNIEGLPSRAREAEMVGPNQEAVYLSVSGNLSAIFLVELRADRLVKFWMKQCVRHNICLILRTVDPMITLNRIETTFEMPSGMLKIIPARMHKEYEKETSPVETMSASMACNGSFAGAAQLLIGTKVLRRAATRGVFVQAVGILLGIGMVLMEAILGLGLSPARMMLFQGLMTLLTLIIVSIRKTY